MLAKLGIIEQVGFAKTWRPTAHARPLTLWELVDRVAALRWLATFADIETARRSRHSRFGQTERTNPMSDSDMRQKIEKDYGGVDIRNTSLQKDPDQPPDDIVQGVLGFGISAGMFGPAKSGKTQFCVDLAVCVAAKLKTKFLNHFNAEGNELVLYLAYEGNKSEFQDRVRRVKQWRGVDDDLRRLTILSRFPQLNTDSGLSELDSLLADLSPFLIIVDCLYAGFRGIDLRQLSAAGGELADFHDVCRENFATPLIVHHTKRDRSQGLSALSGWPSRMGWAVDAAKPRGAL